jgi:transposase
VARHRLALLKKKAHEDKATIVLIDEAGALLAPLVRRTLAPRGQTPILKHRARHRDKVSMAAALTFAPDGELGLHFRTYPQSYVNSERAAKFLESLLGEIPGPVLVLWDRGTMHKGAPLRTLKEKYPRLQTEFLPPYAPQLNPVELLWSFLKYGKMANFAPRDIEELHQRVLEHLLFAQRNPRLLASFWHWSQLPSPQRALAA